MKEGEEEGKDAINLISHIPSFTFTFSSPSPSSLILLTLLLVIPYLLLSLFSILILLLTHLFPLLLLIAFFFISNFSLSNDDRTKVDAREDGEASPCRLIRKHEGEEDDGTDAKVLFAKGLPNEKR